MVQKVVTVALKILEITKTWPHVQAVSRGAVAPSSSAAPVLKIDVFFDGPEPSLELRQKAFQKAEFFETSLDRPKDRFFYQDLPVTVEYKQLKEVEERIQGLFKAPFRLLSDSTYHLHRLAHGITLMDNNGWLESLRSRLKTLPAEFWSFHCRNLDQRLEHNLSDLASAVFNSDSLAFHWAFSRFLETSGEKVFAANRRFLCPAEDLSAVLEEMETLPSGWKGLWDSLVRDDSELDHERKLEIARFLAGLLLKL